LDHGDHHESAIGEAEQNCDDNVTLGGIHTPVVVPNISIIIRLSPCVKLTALVIYYRIELKIHSSELIKIKAHIRLLADKCASDNCERSADRKLSVSWPKSGKNNCSQIYGLLRD
jgi:hypothetical protein